jgi:hypothetical protein
MDEQQRILRMSDAELESYVDAAPAGNLWRNFALEELSRRRLRSIEKGHWALTPTFWVIVATLIFAIIAAWPVIRGWFPG